jgi:hypothetical protein
MSKWYGKELVFCESTRRPKTSKTSRGPFPKSGLFNPTTLLPPQTGAAVPLTKNGIFPSANLSRRNVKTSAEGQMWHAENNMLISVL